MELQAAQSLSGRVHDFEELDAYIKKNTEYLAKLIYGSTAVTPGEQRKVINMLDPFLFMAEMYISFAQLKQISDLDLVVIYQCLLFDFEGKKIIYKFHGYSTPVPTMISIIKQRQKHYYMNLKTMYCCILKRRCCSLNMEEQFKGQILLRKLLWDYADVLISRRNIDQMSEDFFAFYSRLLQIMADQYNVFVHPLVDIIYSLSGYKLKFGKFKDYSILRTFCRENESDTEKITGKILSVLNYPEKKYYQMPVRLSSNVTIEISVIFNHEKKMIILNTDLEYDAVEYMVLYHAIHSGYIPSWDFDDELLKREPPFRTIDFL